MHTILGAVLVLCVGMCADGQEPQGTSAPAPDVAGRRTQSDSSATDNGEPARAETGGPRLVQWEIPVLVPRKAWGGEDTGHAARIRFEWRREPVGEPVQVRLTVDPPGDAAPMTKLSVYVAAMVAGMQRQDPMTGVRIAVRVPGDVEAASASGMLCVAMLSALDGRELPRDAYLLATLLPDGTLGPVADPAGRLRAAKGADVRRVLVPACLAPRADAAAAAKTGLGQLAESLGLRYREVEHIEQAYRDLYGLPEEDRAVDAAAVTRMPQAVHDVLVREARKKIREFEELSGGLSDEERDVLDRSGYKTYYLRQRAGINQAMAEERYRAALGKVSYCTHFLKACKRCLPFFQSLKGLEHDEVIGRCERRFRAYLGAMPDATEVARRLAADRPPIAFQLSTGLIWGKYDARNTAEYHRHMFERDREEYLKMWPLGADAAADERWRRYARLVYTDAVLAASKELEGLQPSREPHPIIPVLPTVSLLDPARPVKVEGFFDALARPAWTTFQQELLTEWGRSRKLTRGEMIALLWANDRAWTSVSAGAESAATFPAPRMEAYSATSAGAYFAAIHADLCRDNIEGLFSLAVRWSMFDGRPEDGKFVYEHAEVLQSLTEISRRRAIQSIAACRQAGIPCPSPLFRFESAEDARRDASVDRVCVLCDYWGVTLQSQLLRMLFRGGEPY